MIVAARILDTGGFGLFYTAVLAITVAISPLLAATTVFGRTLADVSAREGPAAAADVTLRLLWRLLGWGVPAALVAGAVLVPITSHMGIEAWPIALLIPPTVLVLLIPELLRTGFQSALFFWRAAAVWIASQGAQFALAVMALLSVGRTWAGVLGILLGGAIGAAPFVGLLRRGVAPTATGLPAGWARQLGHELPLIASYSLFVLVNNMDVLAAYWLMPRPALDVYSASALLPKAIVTASLPASQVALPVIIERRIKGLSTGWSIAKALTITLGMCAAAAAALWAGIPKLQATSLAIRGLDIPTLEMLASGAVALGALRILVVIEIAVQKYVAGLVQVTAVVAFIVMCGSGSVDPRSMAWFYTISCWGALPVVLAAGLFANRMARNGSPANGKILPHGSDVREEVHE